MRLKDKLVVVTAAGSGIGRESALLFASEGAAVAVVDFDGGKASSVVEDIRRQGGTAYAVQADLTSPDECKRAVDEAAIRLGGIDILWNHAGTPGPGGIEDVDLVAYQHAMDLNLRASVVASGHVVPHMRKRGGGAILLTASVSGLVGSQFSPIYSAAKFAVVGLGKSLALALAADKIRVNVVCPGPVNTPMLPDFMGRGLSAQEAKEVEAKFTAQIPLGRVAEAQDVARAALFLISDDAAYLTGVALPIDGGFTCR
ncbi:3-ketoacyl-ACP reductase [Pandoraea terrae]|uniref:3-ketoacyl-ACP reductase n=1 Tax=Pandoraea terrae TaxID=1537710 RepID=A0A5E4U7V2_9BURK|nr:SDR family oxidoreductase [Pandoraea terrae]VVD95693.1 3-ketoacyl-ACP reductase [Pandoraea terrae]